MFALRPTVFVHVIAWSVTAWVADLAMGSNDHGVRLIRRESRSRRKARAIDTVVAQIQPQGDILSPELAELNGDSDLERRTPTRISSTSEMTEINGAGEVWTPLTRRVSESMAPALGPWAQNMIAALKTMDAWPTDAADDTALQNKLRAMSKNQMISIAREMGIARELIDDATDDDDPKVALLKLVLNNQAAVEKVTAEKATQERAAAERARAEQVSGKRNRLMRMMAHEDIEKMGKPSEEDLRAELDDVDVPDDSPNAHAGKVITEHKFRGCFPLVDKDNQPSDFHDLTCMTTLEKEVPCRGGLPFFSLPMPAGQSYLDCFTFCLSKGLDLSGIVTLEKNRECRCGATIENVGAWNRQEPKKQLLLPPKKLSANDPHCELLVWQYTGGLTEDDSVPYPLLQMSDDDTKYMESIAKGYDVTQEQGADDEQPENMTDVNISIADDREEGYDVTQEQGADDEIPESMTDVTITIDDDRVESNASLFKVSEICKEDPTFNCGDKKGLCRSSNLGPAIVTKCPVTCGICTKYGSFPQIASSQLWPWSSHNRKWPWSKMKLRNCYPHKCGPGWWGPWKTKRSDGNVYIRYFFNDNVDNARKEVFRKAVEEYHQKTCIRWVDVGKWAFPPRIRVGIFDENSCTANVGYPGMIPGTHRINLGWCKTIGNLGTVIHEMGHAIGMGHEQKREDAGKRADIGGQWKGPYLDVHWQNIDSEWKPQYVPDGDGYVGSADDGSGDSFKGYAPYDFESIMHYPRNHIGVTEKSYDTIPRSYNDVVGQRTVLSPGDVLQIKDMYQCGVPGPCKWFCGWVIRKWRKDCSGCSHFGTGASLLADEGGKTSTVANEGPSSKQASANESSNNEDLGDDVAVWVADAWGACKKGRIICIRSRQVVCESPNGEELQEISCDPSQKPSSKQACYCREVAEVPQACAQEDSSFGGKNCTKFRGLDCLGIDNTSELQANCPHTCGLC